MQAVHWGGLCWKAAQQTFLWFCNLSISIKPTSVPQLHAVVQPPRGQDTSISAEHQLVDWVWVSLQLTYLSCTPNIPYQNTLVCSSWCKMFAIRWKCQNVNGTLVSCQYSHTLPIENVPEPNTAVTWPSSNIVTIWMELATINITEMSCQYPQGLNVVRAPYSGSLVMGTSHKVKPKRALEEKNKERERESVRKRKQSLFG